MLLTEIADMEFIRFRSQVIRAMQEMGMDRGTIDQEAIRMGYEQGQSPEQVIELMGGTGADEFGTDEPRPEPSDRTMMKGRGYGTDYDAGADEAF